MLSTNPILLPMFAMIAITFTVTARLFVVRVGEMRRRRIHPQSVATSRERAELLEDSRASDNLANLFELPVLFYVLCLTALFAQANHPWLVYGAWLFAILRAAHSVIQCTYNKVMHRFKVYFASSMVLIALWIGLAVRVLAS